MTDSKLSTSLSFQAISILLITYVCTCVVSLFVFDTFYRLDSLVKAMPAYELLVAISAMFLIFFVVGVGVTVTGLCILGFTWPLREKLLPGIRLSALMFLLLILIRATLHWVMKITGTENWMLTQWASEILGVPLPAAVVLTFFYVLIVITAILVLVKTRRLEKVLKEFEAFGKSIAKATLAIVIVPVAICGYHLHAVAGKEEFPVCSIDQPALGNVSTIEGGKNLQAVAVNNPTRITVDHAVDIEKNKYPNILLVTFDALTARDMSLYGYQLPTTPAMQELAQESYVYEHAVSVSNWTKPGTVSILTGQYPHRHRLVSTLSDAIVLQHPERTLPHQLRAMGYKTTAIVSNATYGHPIVNGTYRSFDVCGWNAFAPGFLDGNIFRWMRYQIRNKMGMMLLDHHIYVSGWLDDLLNSFPAIRFWQRGVLWNEKSPAPPEHTFERAQQALLENVNQPQFIWAHVFSPHNPYLPDEKHHGRFLVGNEFNTFRSQLKIPDIYPESLQPDVNRLRLRYDEYILNSDHALAGFIDFLKKSGRWENTLLIVSADHGESFEDGVFKHHGNFLYEQLTHIPLLIHLPGQQKGMRIDVAASQVDIAPSILRYLNASVPTWMDGEALGLGKAESKTYRYSMQIEENGYRPPIKKGVFTATDGRYKLIYSLNDNSTQLFDIKMDPDESKNIAHENAALVEKMRIAIINEINI